MARSIITAGGDGLSISIEGMDELAAISADYRKAAAREYRVAVNSILEVGQSWLRSELKAYKDTGHAIDSVKIKKPASNAALTLTGSLYVEGEAESYMDTIEFGRAVVATTPPPSELVDWISRHPGFTGTPFVLARAIHERGLPARSPWQNTFDRISTSGVVDKAFDLAMDRVLGNM